MKKFEVEVMSLRMGRLLGTLRAFVIEIFQ
jgi:hypothetical protein